MRWIQINNADIKFIDKFEFDRDYNRYCLKFRYTKFIKIHDTFGLDKSILSEILITFTNLIQLHLNFGDNLSTSSNPFKHLDQASLPELCFFNFCQQKLNSGHLASAAVEIFIQGVRIDSTTPFINYDFNSNLIYLHFKNRHLLPSIQNAFAQLQKINYSDYKQMHFINDYDSQFTYNRYPNIQEVYYDLPATKSIYKGEEAFIEFLEECVFHIKILSIKNSRFNEDFLKRLTTMRNLVNTLSKFELESSVKINDFSFISEFKFLQYFTCNVVNKSNLFRIIPMLGTAFKLINKLIVNHIFL